MLNEGDQAPHFEVLADDGRKVTLADYRGKQSDSVFLSEGEYAGMHSRSEWLPQHVRRFPSAERGDRRSERR